MDAFHETSSWLEKSLIWGCDELTSRVCHRAFVLLRGVRGDQGVAWLGEELRKPSAFKMLSDGSLGGDVQTMLTLLKNFTGKHHEEVVRRQELLGEDAETARKFSQHHDGRHAGQSGENWLSNAATPQGCVGLVQAMKQLQYIAPVAWGYMPGRPVALSDTQVFHMLDAAKGTWPLPSQKNAREYTSMDVGRLYWTLGVVLHRFQNLPLGPTAFASMLRKQGANTQTMWEKLGLADHRHLQHWWNAYHVCSNLSCHYHLGLHQVQRCYGHLSLCMYVSIPKLSRTRRWAKPAFVVFWRGN